MSETQNELENIVIKYVPTTSVMSLKQPTLRELAIQEIQALINTEVLKALDSIEVKKDTRQYAIKGADEGIQIGFNEARDQFIKAIKQVKEKYTV